jgi:metallo-beta-lactamase class B
MTIPLAPALRRGLGRCCLVLASAIVPIAACHASGSAKPYLAPVHDLPAAVQQNVDLAYLLADGDYDADYLNVLLGDVMHLIAPVGTRPSRALRAAKVFDQLYFIGTADVAAWALDTNAGIILFDTLTSSQDARSLLLPGLSNLGLDNARIRKIIVMHGHYDHFGGAAYVQKLTGADVLLSKADWTMIGALPPTDPGAALPKPHHDGNVKDGDVITLGDESVRLYLTPGHTPGTLSAFIPVTDHGVKHVVAFFGGNGLPDSLAPTSLTGGLVAYRASLVRFTQLSIDAGADAVISNHPVVDNAMGNLATQASHRPNGRNPWLVGRDRFIRVMGSNIAAADAAIAAHQL